MLTSVIIPTHNAEHLAEAVGSALDQEVDVEVIVVPNGGATIPSAITADPRVRVVPYIGAPSIGAIKRCGFQAAEGHVLVELDHDDILAPGALGKIAAAVKGGADFIYSNFANFSDDPAITPERFAEAYGWTTRPTNVRGRGVFEHVAFKPTPASLSLIDWAPNHVRAWTRGGYKRAGGHNEALAVCDDHELVIKSYLEGLDFQHIDECLYLYRCRPSQTFREKNAEIRQGTHNLYREHIDALVREWCRREKLPCYDLGGGKNPAPGWVSVDLAGGLEAADLSKRWPWPDSSVGAFRAFDLLEHLPDKMHTLAELHRCLVPGGWTLTLTPSAMGQGGFMDPTHVSYWVKGSFRYVTDRDFAKYINNDSVRFQSMRLVEDFPSEWHRTENIPYVTFDGVALKDGYAGPGEVRI